MEITNINVRKICSNDKMKAVCSVTFDDALVIHDIKIIESDSKTFVAMPSRKNKNGQYSDVAHPINSELRTKLEKAIIDEYQKALESMTE
ncbi:MAG: septation regulator SpoVG [Ruminococcaceae bacterium]|nr:septation regulator SpoVG [Oscillospiraceae bacterium]